MPELLRPFARFHVLGLALIGCLALAVLTRERLWTWIGLIGAVVVSVWAAILLYRDLHRGRDG